MIELHILKWLKVKPQKIVNITKNSMKNTKLPKRRTKTKFEQSTIQRNKRTMYSTFSLLQLIIVIPIVEDDISSPQPKQYKF